MADRTAIDVIDIIRQFQPTALPMTVVVDIETKQIRAVVQEEIIGNTKTRVNEFIAGYGIEYKIEDKGVVI